MPKLQETRRTHQRTCHLCEAMCGIEVELEGDRIASIRGDAKDVLSRGHVCPKVHALKGIHEDPDRLRTPLRRVGDRWLNIDWGEALDEAASRLGEVRQKHGSRSIALYLGNPTVHNYGSMLYLQVLKAAIGRTSLYSATSLDQLPHMLASHLMFGHQLLIPVPDVDRTDFLLMLGANPLVSNGSLMSAGDVGARLSSLRERGGTLVVVDPKRTETAAKADQHIAIRPGSDALLLLAMVHEVFRIGADRPGRLAAMMDGVDTLRELSKPFSPDAVAPATGVSAEVTAALMRDLCAANKPVLYGRVGVCTQSFGGLNAWLINVLNALLGRLDEPGGAMFPTPAADLQSLLGGGSFGRRKSRVRGLPAFSGELPTSTLAEEIETPGDGRVCALITSAGNPVLSAPNGARLESALPKLEFMVSIDIYRNESTRHADLILPPTFGLEHDHYDLAFHMLAVRNTAKYSPAAFKRAADARHDWEILLGLASRLKAGKLGGYASELFGRAPRAVRGALAPAAALDLMLRTGPYGRKLGGLSLRKLKAHPEGIDFGPLQPSLAQHLKRSGGRIELAPEAMVADVARALEHMRAPAADGLVLIGRRELRTNNSWIHNSAKLNLGKRRCTLQMHPEDAAGFEDGQRVSVRTRTGAIEAELEITDSLMPGVVSLPHGWGHHRPGIQLRVASARPGVSVNDITDEELVDPLSGNAAFNGVPVQVEAPREAGRTK
jgi:anaerobic selenocysteine-containing dehydrogenase